jgi:hypothetical protein
MNTFFLVERRAAAATTAASSEVAEHLRASRRAYGVIPFSTPAGRSLRISVKLTREAWAQVSRYPVERVKVSEHSMPAKRLESEGRAKQKTVAQGRLRLPAVPAAVAPSIPAFALRFNSSANSLFNIEAESRLVRFLPATTTRPLPVRVVHRKSRAGAWYEIEVYHVANEEWLLRSTSAKEPGEHEISLVSEHRNDAAESAQGDEGSTTSAGARARGDGRGRPRRQPASAAG